MESPVFQEVYTLTKFDNIQNIGYGLPLTGIYGHFFDDVTENKFDVLVKVYDKNVDGAIPMWCCRQYKGAFSICPTRPIMRRIIRSLTSARRLVGFLSKNGWLTFVDKSGRSFPKMPKHSLFDVYVTIEKI